jgi:hypothetical protein
MGHCLERLIWGEGLIITNHRKALSGGHSGKETVTQSQKPEARKLKN